MLLTPLTDSTKNTKVMCGVQFPSASCTNEAGDSFNLERKNLLHLSAQLEHLNLGELLLESESSSALCPNKISVLLFLSLFDCLISVHLSPLLSCFIAPSCLFFLSVFFPPSAHFHLKVDTCRIYAEVQKSCPLEAYLFNFQSRSFSIIK